jgi:hypothetical protein
MSETVYTFAGCWHSELEGSAAATGAALVLGWRPDADAPVFSDGSHKLRVLQPEITRIHPKVRRATCSIEGGHIHAWVALEKGSARQAVA